MKNKLLTKTTQKIKNQKSKKWIRKCAPTADHGNRKLRLLGSMVSHTIWNIEFLVIKVAIRCPVRAGSKNSGKGQTFGTCIVLGIAPVISTSFSTWLLSQSRLVFTKNSGRVSFVCTDDFANKFHLFSLCFGFLGASFWDNWNVTYSLFLIRILG